MKIKIVFFVLSLLAAIANCTGQQNNIDDLINEKKIFILVSDHYYSDKENWYLYNVVKKKYENIKPDKEEINIFDKSVYWFWDVFSGSSYIWIPGGSESTFYELYYDNDLKLKYSMKAEGYKRMLIGYPKIKTETGFINIIPLGTDNVPYLDYLKVEVTLNSGQKKTMPNYDSNIIRAAYCGGNTIFAEITKSSELPVQTDTILWDYIDDESYYFKSDEFVIGFGEGAAVVTGKDYVGLSIIDVKGAVLYKDNTIDIFSFDREMGKSINSLEIISAYYIHPYIIMNVCEPGTFPATFKIINIETKEYTVLRDGNIFYETYGMFVQ